MIIAEVANPTVTKVFALAKLLARRATDTGATPQYDVSGFINMAQMLGAEVSPDQLQQLVSQPPLNAVIEPMEPDATKIQFKVGNSEDKNVTMPVNRAEEIVAKAAKKAAKKDRGV